ncbi:MAG TPA: hypothetical protein VMV93_10980 [Chloroflexota bacterium]|nr:hypothetical protein [Chloroflexota bacterium]
MRWQADAGLLIISGVFAYQLFWWLQGRVMGRFNPPRPARPSASIHRRLRRLHWLARLDGTRRTRRFCR